MKEIVTNYVKKKDWYLYVKYSFVFRLYVFFFKRQVIKEHQKEVAFYKSFLQPCSLIFDIGAYDGHKTAAFLKLAGKVISCEPDLHSFRTLKIRFRNLSSRVFIENKAVSNRNGTASFLIHHPGSAFNTLNPKWKQVLECNSNKIWNEEIRFSSEVTVELITIDQLIRKYGKPCFIKIDVEGYEENVLKGLTEMVPFLSFECQVPDCRTELLNCLDYLIVLDKGITFNIAKEEGLLFDKFVDYNFIVEWVSATTPASFEIIARSSAYNKPVEKI